jgi:hypothetical protein
MLNQCNHVTRMSMLCIHCRYVDQQSYALLALSPLQAYIDSLTFALILRGFKGHHSQELHMCREPGGWANTLQLLFIVLFDDEDCII